MEQEASVDDWMGINRNCWPGGGDRLLSNSIASSRCSLVLFSSRPACPYHFVFGEQHQWPHSSQTRLQLITNQREMESVGEDFSALLLSIYIKRNQPTPSGVSPLCYVGGRPRFNLLDSCHHTIICSRRERGDERILGLVKLKIAQILFQGGRSSMDFCRHRYVQRASLLLSLWSEHPSPAPVIQTPRHDFSINHF